MTPLQILDASGLVILAAQSVWILLLYRRMGRLRSALEGAGDVVGQLDEASRRLDESAGGIVQKVADGIAEVESKIQSCRRLSQELSSAARNAEEVAIRLDQALKLNRRLNQARAAAPPRELVEPLGLAERLAGRGAEAAPVPPEPPVPPSSTPIAAPAPLLPTALRLPPLVVPPLLDLPLAATPTPTEEADAPFHAPPLPASLQPAAGLPPSLPPLQEVLAAELLFAGLAAEAPPARTIRVKLD